MGGFVGAVRLWRWACKVLGLLVCGAEGFCLVRVLVAGHHDDVCSLIYLEMLEKDCKEIENEMK